MSDNMDTARSKSKTEERIEHLETIDTTTPPGEVEKGNALTQQPTNGPKIHHKVIFRRQFNYRTD